MAWLASTPSAATGFQGTGGTETVRAPAVSNEGARLVYMFVDQPASENAVTAPLKLNSLRTACFAYHR